MGKEVAIEGKLINRSYDDKEGNKKYVTEIVAESFIVFDKPSENQEITASLNKNNEKLRLYRCYASP